MNYVKNFNFYGTDAKEIPCVTGSGAPQPTTQGAVGLLYMDTNNGKVYKCTAVTNEISTWELLVSGGGGGENIQSDWNQKDESAPDYIKNKPDDIEHTSYKVQPWSQLESYSEKHYPSMYMLEEMIEQKFSGVDSDIVVLKMDKENLSNKVSLISKDSTHDQYPSAKAVADYFKYMQDSGSNDIYIDDNVYILDKYVPFDEINDYICNISKNEDGSWSANEDGFYVNDMHIGETYRIMSCLIDMEFTLTEDDWDGGYFKYYSDDLKSELWLTGVYITTEEDAEYFGEDIGTFLAPMGYIYYDSDIGEDVFGTPVDEIPWEEYGWGSFYYLNDTITIEYFEPQKIDYRHLPEDIATQDMITATQNMIPQNTESIENKIQSFEEMDENSDSQYPSAKAVVDFSDKKENRSNKLKKLINSVTHTSYPSSRAVMDYIKSTNGDWELLEEIKDNVMYVFDNTGETWSALCEFNVGILEFNKNYTLVTDITSVDFNLGNYADFPSTWMLDFDIDGGKVSLHIIGAPGYWDNDLNDFVYDGYMYDAQMSINYYSDVGEEIPLINGLPPEFMEGYAVTPGIASVGCYTPHKIGKDNLPNDVEFTSNKINTWDELGDDTNGEVKYPTVKFLMGNVSQAETNAVNSANAYTDMKVRDVSRDTIISDGFELIKSDTFTEEVVQITPTLNGRYKELIWIFDVKPEPDTEKTEKARVFLFPTANPTNVGAQKIIQQGNYVISVYKTTDWRLWISVKMIGNYAYSELWWGGMTTLNNGYALSPNENNQIGIAMPGMQLSKNYIDEISLWLYSLENTRVFPAGTTYELWGVRETGHLETALDDIITIQNTLIGGDA